MMGIVSAAHKFSGNRVGFGSGRKESVSGVTAENRPARAQSGSTQLIAASKAIAMSA